MVNSLLAVLETYEIVIIVVVAAAFIGVIVAALIFRSKRRRTVDETVLDSRDEVNENANAVKVLQALAEGKPDMLEKLAALYDSLLYLTPSAEDEVAVIDEKIKNALGDIKIELSKTRGEEGSGKAEKYSLKLGSGQFIPGFEDQMIGKSIGEPFDVEVTFPEDYHAKELAGKAATFKCLIHEIKVSELPALDDEFAKDVSEFDTLDEYKADVKAKLQESANKTEDAKVDDQLMSALCENIEGEIPEVMFDNEAENLVRDYENRLRYQGMDLNTFMKYTGQTVETLKAQFRPQAEKQVKTRLALEYVAKAESLTATEEDINTEYQKIADAYGIELDKVKESIEEKAIAADVEVGKAALFVRDNADISKGDGAAAPKKRAPRKKKVAEVEPETVSEEKTEETPSEPEKAAE